jgi:hypothetical protein
LQVGYPDGDAVLCLINGKPAPRIGGTKASMFDLPAGVNQVCLLYENHGHANGGKEMENTSGIRTIRTTSNRFSNGSPIEGWRMQIVNNTTNRSEIRPDFNDSNWTSVVADNLNANQLTPNQAAVFRAEAELTPAELNNAKMILSFGRIDDFGWVYVNGKKIGETTNWASEYSFDVTKVIHPGRNIVAVVVQNIDGSGGIGLPMLSALIKEPTTPLEAWGRPTGDEEQWYKPDFNDTKWESIPIGTIRIPWQIDPVLTWYRMNFSLPSPQEGVWVPWRLHLTASGNGFLYLNGHALGRYWDAGPQHDFFLPECWLHFGNGQINNLTLNLRPTEGGVGIQSAVIEPYSDFAEKR